MKDLYVQSSRQLQQKEEEVGGVRMELKEAVDERTLFGWILVTPDLT